MHWCTSALPSKQTWEVAVTHHLELGVASTVVCKLCWVPPGCWFWLHPVPTEGSGAVMHSDAHAVIL